MVWLQGTQKNIFAKNFLRQHCVAIFLQDAFSALPKTSLSSARMLRPLCGLRIKVLRTMREIHTGHLADICFQRHQSLDFGVLRIYFYIQHSRPALDNGKAGPRKTEGADKGELRAAYSDLCVPYSGSREKFPASTLRCDFFARCFFGFAENFRAVKNDTV